MDATEVLKSYQVHLESEKCMRPRSVKDYMVVAHALNQSHSLSGSLSYKEINDSLRALKERLNWSQGTIYKYSICTRHLFRWLQREQYRPDNPYPFAEWRKPRPHTPKFLIQDQFDRLIDDPHLTHQETTLLYILWDTGARIGEITALEQRLVDLNKMIVNIPYEISKGNYSFRYIPITKNATERLKMQFGFAQRRGHEKSIFLNAQSEPMTVSGLQKVVSAIGLRYRNNIRLSARQFRRSFGIRMLEKGVPQVIVQKWLGHQTLQMTSHYVNLCADSSRRIFDKFVMA